jgi:biotin carboxylase
MLAAEKLGVEIYLGTNEKQALEDLSSGRILAFDFEDVENGSDQIVRATKEIGLDAVVSVDDGANVLSAAAARKLGLRHNDPDAVSYSRNKYHFRQRLEEAGCLSPRFELFPLDANPSEIARSIEFPCVIKPLTLNMSRGVIRADGHNSFVAAFDRVADIIRQPDARTPGIAADNLMVESYVPGKEYAVEGLIRNGELIILAVFDKPDPLEGPYFEETIYVTPAPISAELKEDIRLAAQAAIAAIGLTDGPTHIDLRVNDDGVYIIEADARTIGGHCGRSLQFPGGMRLEDIVLRHALDLPIETFENPDSAGGVMMIPIPKSGYLRETKGLKKARSVASIYDISITIAKDHRVVTLPDGGRYLGFIIAHANTADEVTDALRTAHGHLEFIIDDSTECE